MTTPGFPVGAPLALVVLGALTVYVNSPLRGEDKVAPGLTPPSARGALWRRIVALFVGWYVILGLMWFT